MDPTVIDSPGAGITKPCAAESPAQTIASDQLVVGDIPALRSGFHPRPVLLSQLDRASQGPPAAVLTGTRGAGKTQLAATYARDRLAVGWRLVAWVNACDSGRLLAGMAAVAGAAGLRNGGSRQGTADAGQAVRTWLEADGGRCLLVFDDVEDPELVRPFVPAAGAARVLIIAAREPAAELGTSVPVDVFSAEEAMAFLDGRTGLADEAGAAAVAAELGYLPLALDQAAGLIARQRLEYAAYLAKLRARSAEAYPDREEKQRYPPGAAEAVLLSMEATRAADPLGVSTGVMELMAMLSPTVIRRELLRAAGSAGTLLGGGRRVVASMVDQALERLNERSLLGFSLDSQAVIVHCLVARVVREGLARRGHLETACRAAASALHYVLELGDSMDYAIAIGEPLIPDLEQMLGPEHPDTLSARNSLAAAYHAAGRNADAIPLIQQTLAARERVLGPDHPGTLASRNNLASAYRATGRPAQAIPLFERNLDACERLLGSDHPKTVASRLSLDLARQESAQAENAAPVRGGRI